MKVIVAMWEHRHGREVRVFKNEEAARQWRRDIADDNWEEEIGNKDLWTRRPTPSAISRS